MMGNSGVGCGVGDGQEVARLGAEHEVWNLVIENVEIEIRPGERHPLGQNPIQALAGNVPHLGTAAPVVVDDPKLGYFVPFGTCDERRSRVLGACGRLHGRVDRRQPMGWRSRTPNQGEAECAAPLVRQTPAKSLRLPKTVLNHQTATALHPIGGPSDAAGSG